jgi:ADP-ribose pyrophosphatase YjhB (NUDIX family)
MSKLIGMVLRPFWRMTRGMTLGAQAMVIDDQNRVLVVRHGYRPGWHFPGGGVEWNETIQDALARELHEETGVELAGEPQLHGVFSNFKAFPGDHIVVFVVRKWQQPAVPQPNMEIREQKFVSIDRLPDELVDGARNRISEYFEGVELKATWVE